MILRSPRIVGVVAALACHACHDEKPVDLGTVLAKIARLTGDVRTWSRATSTIAWEAAAIGQSLFAGDKVQTAENARATVQLSTGGDLHLGPGSIVVIEGPGERTPGRVSVQTGEIDAVFTSSTATAELLVASGEGGAVRVARAPGSGRLAYRVNARDSGVIEVAVTEGRADLTEESGRTEQLKKRQALDIKGRRIVSGIVELPDPPAQSSPKEGERVPADAIDLRWRKKEDASGYRVQIATDASFEEIVQDRNTSELELRFVPIGPAVYYWRVAARDKKGRTGDFGPARALSAEAIVDVLIAPRPDAVFSYWKARPSIVFSWTLHEPGTRFVLVVGREPSLEKKTVLVERTDSTRAETDRLDAGTYYWGVFSEEDGGRTPLFARARKLTVKKEQLKLKVQKRLRWE